MKNKAGLFVLVAEIAAIVILHTARTSTKTEAERQITTQQSQINHYTLAQDHPGASITLK